MEEPQMCIRDSLIDAKEHHLVTDREEKENFVDLFVRNAALMPEPNRKLIDCMYAVSYTHLDVYKRQIVQYW